MPPAMASRSAFSSTRCRPGFSARTQRGVRVMAKGLVKQIPIFPLNVVALPSASVPLMIFEARYRVLFNTILAGEAGIEDGLVQADSPFCGTKRFGMCYVDGRTDASGASRMASVGTMLDVVEFAHVSDGRIFLTTKGAERFRILSIVRERPIMIAEVEELSEDMEEGEEVAALAKEVSDLLRSTIRLNVKLNSIEASEDQLEPEELAGLGPRELSYWVASFFGDIKVLQQSLLEEDSTVKRLNREKDILADTVKYYSATVALKSLSTPSVTSDISAALDAALQDASPAAPSAASQDAAPAPAPASPESPAAADVPPSGAAPAPPPAAESPASPPKPSEDSS